MDDSLEDQYREEGQQSSQKPQSPGFLTRMVNKGNSFYDKYQAARGAGKWFAKQGAKKAAEKAAQAAAARVATATAAATSEVWVPVLLIITIVVIFVLIATFLIVLLLGPTLNLDSSDTPSPTPAPNITPIAGGGSVAACLFYNGGKAAGFTANPLLAREIQEISSQIRFTPTDTPVPAQILMAIMAHEREQLFRTSDNSLIDADYDAKISLGTARAIGAAQMVPSTFRGAVDWAVANNIPLVAGKNQALVTLDRRATGETDQYYRITSIKDSIAVASFEILKLKRRYSPTDDWITKSTVHSIAGRYQGGEENPIGGCSENYYCEDVWKSVGGCVPTAIAAGEGPRKVDQMVNLINADPTCRQVTQNNYRTCSTLFGAVDPDNKAKQAMIDFMYRNRNTRFGFYFQCMGFAETATALVYNGLTSAGYPWNYIFSPPAGYQFIQKGTETMTSGNIAIFWNGDELSSGHIAYIEEVFLDRGFRLSEANYELDGSVRNNRTVYDTVDFRGWLKKL